MGRSPYTCNQAAYERHYCQDGSGAYPYFKGHLMQRGYGNLLGSLIKSGIPLVKALIKSPLAKQVGKQALRTGKHLLDDLVVRKKPIKKTVKKRLGQAIQEQLQENLAERMHMGGAARRKRRRRTSLDILGN